MTYFELKEKTKDLTTEEKKGAEQTALFFSISGLNHLYFQLH